MSTHIPVCPFRNPSQEEVQYYSDLAVQYADLNYYQPRHMPVIIRRAHIYSTLVIVEQILSTIDGYASWCRLEAMWHAYGHGVSYPMQCRTYKVPR